MMKNWFNCKHEKWITVNIDSLNVFFVTSRKCLLTYMDNHFDNFREMIQDTL